MTYHKRNDCTDAMNCHASEREELAAHVEAHARDFKEYDDEFARGFKHATDVFLAHLRQSDAPQGCCGNCNGWKIGGGDGCVNLDCPCHKKAPQGDNKQ